MLEKLRRCYSVLFDRQGAGRYLTVLPSDVFIVSYPRSGNTWFRFLVANLVSSAPVSFGNIESLVPDIYTNSDIRLRRTPQPRILKSHEAFTPGYRSVVYLVRDPRDVAVSYYDYAIKVRIFEKGFPLDRFVEHFLDSSSKINYFGSWGEHVRSWMAAERPAEAFTVIRYEDLLSDAPAQLRRVSNLLGVPAEPDRIERAVQLSAAEKMRRSEYEFHDRWSSTKGSLKDKQFVRKAKRGAWKEEMPADLADRILERWPDLMERFGYL